MEIVSSFAARATPFQRINGQNLGWLGVRARGIQRSGTNRRAVVGFSSSGELPAEHTLQGAKAGPKNVSEGCMVADQVAS